MALSRNSATRAAVAMSRLRAARSAQHSLARAASSFTLPTPLVLESGEVLERPTVVYETYGDPRAPCILHPTSFDAKHPELEYAIGPGRVLDTDKYFVVVPVRVNFCSPVWAWVLAHPSLQNQLGNGLSSSPSNNPAGAASFPRVSVADNHALLAQLGVSSLALCYGYSMGGMQALHWASLYPSFVRRVVATAATASVTQPGAVFLEGLLAILAPLERRRDVATVEEKRELLAAFGRVYAGWGLPSEWYRRELWRTHGAHASLDAFLAASWEAWTCGAHPGNLRSQLRTWCSARLSPAQLARITARVVYMPSPGDRYFAVEDVEAEASHIAGSRVVPLSLEWGHRAGDPHRDGQQADLEKIRATVEALLMEDR